MTLSWDSVSPNGCGFKDFSNSMRSMSVVPSDLPPLPAGDLIAPREAIVSRIEMRLLSDTRSVLEYLSHGELDLGVNGTGRGKNDKEALMGPYSFPKTAVLSGRSGD